MGASSSSGSEIGDGNANKKSSEEDLNLHPQKFPQVICFNCGETGHFSSGCVKPKVCFMCFCKDHVVENCGEWKKPQPSAQFYGSANRGLGFYHVDVANREGRFKHWAGFENYGVFTVEEGFLEEDEIIKTLRQQVDKNWAWKLLRMDEFRFLVKFPPHIRVESKVLGEATYFYLKNNSVMASLRVWNGDIEPVGQLMETWIQIRGVPPKWSDWTTIREITSTLGKLIEVDWQTLFSSFFTVIRVKINCKDPRKIPDRRVMEMADKLYMISFEVEELDKLKEKMEELNDGLDPSHKGDEDGGERPEEEEDYKPENELPPTNDPDNGNGRSSKQVDNPNNNSGKKTYSVRKALLLLDEKEETY
ncbi:uncharacterized protein LOC120702264 [Panicum virgatum]|uniref:uncharacterized protein LOC120702264 n=1 Tax=Panicum virgatum TaxID=38727 RepID=UPI0019D5D29A|nr:uncharacterized protein LOC120702264 [Panicum virgatum]